MFHKIREVKPMEDYRLTVFFQNGEERIYDVKPLCDRWEAFKALQTVTGLFVQVKADIGGYGVRWNDEIDLACDELYYNGETVKSCVPAE
ncbi:MAG: DUF2442 domain-containing protein [Christensenellaceae bacterium]|jgi:hypothetical protein|nr:DUF2442 domain-containing protein [Christensenellaceae bacterium]